MQYYFRCKENPKAPLFVTDQRWEAEEFAKHSDYERVDAEGRLLQSSHDAFDNVQLAKDPVERLERKVVETDEPFVAEDLY
jgi:hypothetical protein